RKVFVVSTPTIEGDSRIAESYEETDKRVFLVPCPSCDTFQRLVWSRLKFERRDDLSLDPESVRYACQECGELISEDQKMAMIRRGRWEATSSSMSPVVRGYHISALYSPWASWISIAEKFLAAKSNPRQLQTFVNTYLGETFANQGEAPDWKKLWRRRESYDADLIPAGALVLTAGVDVQQDRLEMEIVGWGQNLESWSIQYEVIHGDTATDETYEELERYLTHTWRHESGGRVALSRLLIDAGDAAGGVTNIYRWASRHVPRVMPIRGRTEATQMVYREREATLRKGKSRKRKLGMFWPVGVGLIKSELYSFLRLEEPEPDQAPPFGWCHFPHSYDDEYFKQLTAERKRLRPNSQGIPKANWKVIEGRRNEALDCRVYARAGAYVEGIDSWSPARWEQERQDLTAGGEAKAKKPKRSKPQNTNFIPRPRGGKKWLNQPGR
ncbi:MAG: terminase gpA endonuclease subunit, partial [Planctomycetota bacterium]